MQRRPKKRQIATRRVFIALLALTTRRTHVNLCAFAARIKALSNAWTHASFLSLNSLNFPYRRRINSSPSR